MVTSRIRAHTTALHPQNINITVDQHTFDPPELLAENRGLNRQLVTEGSNTVHQYEKINVSPLTPALGAVIKGIDLSVTTDDQTISELEHALGHFGVIFFEDQQLSPQQHLAFASRFGRININRFFSPVEGHPAIAEVRKEPDQTQNIGSKWHTDHSYDNEPAMGSILRAIEVPAAGGDTMFASLAGAYETLSPKLKKLLLSLKAWHSSRHVFGNASDDFENRRDGRIGNADLATQDACHPMVIAHPISGRPTLYVNPQFTIHIDGWNKDESAALLNTLWEHVVRDENICRFKWKSNALAFWDNRATWHLALNDYHGHRRLMHRITVDGGPLAAFSADLGAAS